jgi:hypothetical protein
LERVVGLDITIEGKERRESGSLSNFFQSSFNNIVKRSETM